MDALVPREWTREEMYRAAEAGVVRPDERLELIDGQLVAKISPQGNPHVICVLLLEDWLREIVGKERHVRTQTPLPLGPRDEPEPDVMVEVGDSTLTRDRRLKVPRYAAAEIAEVWGVDVENRRLEIYREPEAAGYGVTTILSEERAAAPLFAPEARVSIAELLPARRP